MKMVTAVCVLIVISDEVVQKVSRVYQSKVDAEKYKAEIEAAIKSGARKDVLSVWIQENVRLY